MPLDQFNSSGDAPAGAITPELTLEFLSGARVFAKAVRDVFEAAVLRDVAGEKLSFSQLKLLYLVSRTAEVTIGDAATFLGVSNSAASKTVEKLVRRRLLRRSDIQGDRRTSQLFLTEASRRLLENYEAERNEKAARIFSQFSVSELKHTAEVLDRLAAGIVSQGPDGEGVCLQCEIYLRGDCRFGQLGHRTCFYKKHARKQDSSAGGDRPAG